MNGHPMRMKGALIFHGEGGSENLPVSVFEVNITQLYKNNNIVIKYRKRGGYLNPSYQGSMSYESYKLYQDIIGLVD